MTPRHLLITGVGGLVGSALADAALAAGWSVHGIDDDSRGRWFGSNGSVASRLDALEAKGVQVRRADFRFSIDLVQGMDAIVHCAAQPSDDMSRRIPLADFVTNAYGTLVLLEAMRVHAKHAVFVLLSTNKVYGDHVNLAEYATVGSRFEPVRTYNMPGFDPDDGINEDFSIDRSLHTPFGVSKLCADLLTQEWKRTYGLNTVVLRLGCVTGPTGAAVELHGFLGYLVQCAVHGRPYTVYGHRGHQVRDNLAASDLVRAILYVLDDPPQGPLYNMGGGRANSISINEAIIALKKEHGLQFHISEGSERLGDHKW